jgi:hypothetical protein
MLVFYEEKAIIFMHMSRIELKVYSISSRIAYDGYVKEDISSLLYA